MNYNNTSYDLELATFGVTRTGITDLVQTFENITGASGSGGASSLQRVTEYFKGDFVTCKNAPGWVTLYCTTPGVTAEAEPVEYSGIAQVGDRVTDGTCVFTARNVIGELDALGETSTTAAADVEMLKKELLKQVDNRIPPVGTIKYSAVDLGEEWLRCDGSFISEDDYPELVSVMGKLTPGTDKFKSALSNAGIKGAVATNCVVWDGTAYVYLVDTKKLVAINSTGSATAISITGADALAAIPSRPVVLSICAGGLYLCQLANDVSTMVVLECSLFDKSATTLSMTTLDVAGKVTVDSPTGIYVWPEVVTVSGRQYMAVCTHPASIQYYDTIMAAAISWTAGSFETTASVTSYEWRKYETYSQSSYPKTSYDTFHSLLAYHNKNGGDMIAPFHALVGCTESQWNGFAGGFMIYFSMASFPQNIFGNTTKPNAPPLWCDYNGESKSDAQKDTVAWAAYQEWIVNNKTIGFNVVPVAAQNECLYNAEIESRHLTILVCNYNPRTMLEYKTIDTVRLPSAARLGKDSIVYADEQGMWFIFVGTGILFTESLKKGQWGYMDTSATLGVITSNQSIVYDNVNNILYVSGNAASGSVVGQIVLADRFNYATDGAWLPIMEKDSIPAYIKAKEPTT